MKLSDHLSNEELQRLELAWRRLKPWQKKIIRLRVAVGTFPRNTLNLLREHVARRYARFAYFYPAHWVRRIV